MKLCRRFPETTGEEVVEAFTKIKELGTTAEYQEKVEELKVQMLLALRHVRESHYISVFTNGLKGEIKSMVTTYDDEANHPSPSI